MDSRIERKGKGSGRLRQALAEVFRHGLRVYGITGDAAFDGGPRRGSGNGGRDVGIRRGQDEIWLRLSTLGRLTRSAMAWAAAIFMASLMSVARTSMAPRKMPGKASTLLI